MGVGVARGEVDSTHLDGLNSGIADAVTYLNREDPLEEDTVRVLGCLTDVVGRFAEEAASQAKGRPAPLMGVGEGPDGKAVRIIFPAAVVYLARVAQRAMVEALKNLIVLGQLIDRVRSNGSRRWPLLLPRS